MSHVHAFSCIHTFNSLYSFILFCWWFSNCLSLPLSPSCVKSALWHPNTNPLSPRTLSVLGHPLLLLTLLLLMYGSMMIKPERTFRRTFLDEAFIQNAKSIYWIFLILTFPLSSIIGVGGHCVTFWSLVPP